MGIIKIDWASPPPTIGAAALLYASLAAPIPALGDQHYKALPRDTVRWSAPNAAHASFQGISVFHGTTAATASTFPYEDPWEELAFLEQNWDGDGAAAVSSEAIQHARKFALSLALEGHNFEPFAHPNGSVGLEEKKNNKSAYIVISPTERFTYVLRIAGRVHRGDNVDPSTMREILALLY